MEDWNPMEEDYYSLAFNSYDRGQGLGIPLDHLPAGKAKYNKMISHTVSLYVTNIPLEIEEKGLERIFSKYGQVLRVYRGFPRDLSINRCFGFVDYANVREAELALRNLDGKPPYNLRIVFAMSKKEKQEQIKLKEEEMDTYLMSTMHAEHNESVPSRNKSGLGNNYGNAPPLADSNALFVGGVGRGSPFGRNLPKLQITSRGDAREIYISENSTCPSDHNSYCEDCNGPTHSFHTCGQRKDDFYDSVSRNLHCVRQSYDERMLCGRGRPLIHPIYRNETNPFGRDNGLHSSAHHKCHGCSHNICHQCHETHISRMPCCGASYDHDSHMSKDIYLSGNVVRFIGNDSKIERLVGEEAITRSSILSQLSGGQCLNCSKYGSFCCSICKEWYCSKGCQIEHWPKHKQYCKQKKQGDINENEHEPDEQNTKAREKAFLIERKENKHKIEQKEDIVNEKNQHVNFVGKQQMTMQRNREKSEKGNHKNRDQNNYNRHQNPNYQKQQQRNNNINKSNESQFGRKKQRNFIINNRDTKEVNNNVKFDASENQTQKLPFSSLSQTLLHVSKTKLEYESLEGNSNTMVAVSSGFSPNNLWVHKIPGELNKLEILTKDLQEFCAKSKSYLPKVGEICGVLYSQDKTWYRGRIEQINRESRCNVYYVDFGNSEITSKADIRQLSDRFMILPAQAIHCKLSKMEPAETWSKQALDAFSSALGSGILKAKFVRKLENNQNEIELYNEEGESISDVLVRSGLVKSLPVDKKVLNSHTLLPAKDVQELKRKEIKFSTPSIIGKLKGGIEFSLSIVVPLTEKDFWAQPITEEACQIMEKLTNLSEYAERRFNNPKSGDTVIAQAVEDSCYYRAYLINKKDDKYHVRYLDYGNEENVTKIAPISSEHLNLPSIGIHCFIDKKLSSEAELLFKKCISSSTINVKVNSANENIIHMTVMNPDDNMKVTELTGYPWYHDLNSESVSEENSQPSLLRNSTPKKSPVESIQDVNLNKREEIDFAVPSIMEKLEKEIEFDLAVVIPPTGKDFWAQPIVDTACDVMGKLADLHKYEKDMCQEYNPKPGDVLIAQSVEDKQYYRAYVINKKNDKCYVRYLDYGNEEDVTKVIQISSKHLILPSISIHCFIDNKISIEQELLFKKNFEISSVLSVKMKSFNKDQVNMEVVNPDDDTIITELTGYPWYHDLNSKPIPEESVKMSVSSEQFPVLASPQPAENICTALLSRKIMKFTVPSIIKKLEEGTEMDFVVVIPPTGKDFWVQPMIEQAFEIVEKLKNLEDCAKSASNEYIPKPGEIIIAQSILDDCYYRAYLINMKDDKYHVLYLDYGNEEDVSKVVQISQEHSTVPSFSIHCFMEGKLSPEKESLFNQYATTVISAKIISTSEDQLKMEMINPQDHTIITEIVGYPWYHHLNKEDFENSQSSVQESDSVSEEQFVDLSSSQSVGNTNTDTVARSAVPSALSSLDIGTEFSLLISEPYKEMFSAMIGEESIIEKIVEIETAFAKEFTSKKNEPFRTLPDNMVAACALFDGFWHRAYVLKLVDSSYLVRYIDYAKEEVVENIQYLEKQYYCTPSASVYCTIVGDIGNDLKDILEKIIVKDGDLLVKVAAYNGDKVLLDLMQPDGKDVICQLEGHSWYHDLTPCGVTTDNANSTMSNDLKVDVTTTEDGKEEMPVCQKDISAQENEGGSSCNSMTTNVLKADISTTENDNDAERYEEELSVCQKDISTHENEGKSCNNTMSNDLKVISTEVDVDVPNIKSEDNLKTVLSISTTLKPEMEVTISPMLTFPDKLDFWASIYNFDVVKSLAEMQNSLNMQTDTNKLNMPNVGDIIAAKSVTNDSWYRAYVLSVNGDSIKVRYIDHGNEELVSTYKLLTAAQLNIMSPTIYCTMTESITTDKVYLEQLFSINSKFLVKINTIDIDRINLTVITNNGAEICKLTCFPWYYNLESSNVISGETKSPVEEQLHKPEAELPSCVMYKDMKKLHISDIENSEIQVVSIETLHKLYIQPVSCASEVTCLLNKMSAQCKHLQQASCLPVVDQMVCAKFSADEMWYRGRILTSSSGSYHVCFVDYGNSEEVECAYIRPLPKEFAEYPVYSVCVKIDEVPSILPTAKVQALLQGQIWNVKVIDSEKSIVQLLDSDGVSVIDKLKQLKTDEDGNDKQQESVNSIKSSEVIQPNTEIQEFDYSDCQYVQFPIDKVMVVVTSIISPETFFCCLCDDKKISALVNLNNDITSHCEKTEYDDSNCPVVGKICLAKFSGDGLWYRAVPLQTVNEKVQVLFVDFGNVECIEYKNTRSVLSKFMQLPLQAVQCTLHGIASQDNWSTEVITELLAVLPQQEPIEVTVREKIQELDMYVIDIPKVTEHLIQKELVQPL